MNRKRLALALAFIAASTIATCPNAFARGDTTAITNVQSAGGPRPDCGPEIRPDSILSMSHPRAVDEVAHMVQRADYPQESVRLKEQGIVYIGYCVKEDGRVENVRVERSSGFAPLDAAAIKLANARFRFTPAKDVNGAPFAMWVNQAIGFRLRDLEDPEPQPIPGVCRDKPSLTQEPVPIPGADGSLTIRRQVLINKDGTIGRLLILRAGGWKDVDAYTIASLNRDTRYFAPTRGGAAECWINSDLHWARNPPSPTK